MAPDPQPDSSLGGTLCRLKVGDHFKTNDGFNNIVDIKGELPNTPQGR